MKTFSPLAFIVRKIKYKAAIQMFFIAVVLFYHISCKGSVYHQSDNKNALEDTSFNNGSKISTFLLNDSRVTNLALLGKVWGFLKYYHPAVTAGNYNWDYELFRILPTIIDCKDSIERNTILLDWVEKLGIVKGSKIIKTNIKKLKFEPDYSWITVNDLGSALYEKLIRVKKAKRSDESYYVGLVQGVSNPEFRNENAYSNMKYPDTGFRLLCLFRYWNIIQYYFPYKNLIEENWNDVLKAYIPKFIDAQNEEEYLLTVTSLIAQIHDTHANIWSRHEALETIRGHNIAPLEVNFVENKAVVIDYLNRKDGLQTGVVKGDVVDSIGNKSVDDIIKEQLPYTPASNYPTQLRNIAGAILRTNDTLVRIVYRHNNKSNTAFLKCRPVTGKDVFEKYKTVDTCFKMVTPDIACIYPGSIKNEYLPAIMEKVSKTKGLIIDFRCYPSDFIVFSLSGYLFAKPTTFVKFSNGSIQMPGLFTFRDDLLKVGGHYNAFSGKLVIIVNASTQSSAEYHTMAFRAVSGSVVIGSTTAGADGNVSRFNLPGDILTMISGIGVYYPDGRETQRVGIVPDIEVHPTIKGIAENKDELMDKAVEIINQSR